MINKLASAIYNDIVSGLAGITSTPTISIDQLEDDIKCGDVNINIPDEEFKRMIDKHLCNSIGTICYN